MGRKKGIWVAVVSLLVVVVATGFFLLKPKGEPGEALSTTPTEIPTSVPTPRYEETIGNFLITGDEVCREEGKPAVYFFGSSTCPHCVWEKPIAQKVFAEFEDLISYHENFDSDKDSSIYLKYADVNSGYVPFMVLGCRYARVGGGESLGSNEEESKKLEEEALTAILCKLTSGNPDSVCDSVKDKTSEVK